MIPSNERRRTSYIGRKDELDLLNGILDDVRSGKGRLVLVEGEAGIGKTRLIQEMKDLPNFSDFNLLVGRCLYFKDTDIYLPFKEMFNQFSRMMKDLDAESPFSPSLGNQGGDDLSPSEGDFVPMSLIPAGIDQPIEEEDQMRVEGLMEFDKLSDFIFKLSSRGPVCLFIDDLHWADPPSIKLLQYLAQKIVDQPIMIICTYRPEDLFWGEDTPHPLADPLKRLSRDKLYVPIELKRLSKEETETLIRDILEIEKVPGPFCDLIFSRTSGNPFFVEEVIYSLLERNIIDPVAPEWHKNIDPDTISLPTTLRDIILRRMHWLQVNSIAVIRLSSVSSGTKITFEVIKDALKMADEEVLEAIEELVTAKFLKEMKDDESYEFENPVIQEVIYSELNHSRRRFLHTKMANVLESRFSQNPSYWGNIGIHFYKGKDYEKALHYLIKASSYFQKVSPHKALEYLHMVLFCIEKLPQSDSVKDQNLKVLLEISNLCLKIWDWDRSMEFAEKALNLATVIRRPVEKIKAKVNVGEIMRFRGDYDKALPIYQEIISSPGEEDSESFARAYMGIGYIYWKRGEFPRALEMFSKSLQYAKLENNLNTIGSLYINIGNVFNHRGDTKKALDYYTRGIRHLESFGNSIEASRGYSNIGGVHLQLDELEEAEKNLELAITKAKEQGKQEPWWPMILKIKLKALQNHFSDSDDIYERVFEDLKDKDDRVALASCLMYAGFSKIREGRYEEAETFLVRSISIFESLNIPFDLSRSKNLLGDLYLKTSRFDEARTFFSESYKVFKGIGAKRYAEEVRGKLLELRGGDGYI
jgi:tetratricopeptide (TPR) repeat protein